MVEAQLAGAAQHAARTGAPHALPPDVALGSASSLRDRIGAVREAVDAVLAGFGGAADAERWAAVAAVGELVRAADAAAIRVAGALAATPPRTAGTSLARSIGYRSTAEALRHELGVTARHARDLEAVAAATRDGVALSGATVPARLPVLGAAVEGALVSLAQARAIAVPLEQGGDRVAAEGRTAAERALVDAATGIDREAGAAGEDAAPLPPEELGVQARAWLAALDPDGLEPRDDAQRAERSFRLGRRADGMAIGRLVCTPEQGAALQAVLDAHTAPRTPSFADAQDDAEEADDRTRPQAQCDVLLGIVEAHARSGEAPRIGGAAPTLVVTVPAEQLERAAAGDPAAWARIEGTGDVVPAALAARILCDGHVQAAAIDPDGHVLELSRSSRLFTAAQRRAIALRDGGCRGPGCSAPPGWCEAHHVQSWQTGGATDVDNGLLLCSRCHHDVHRGRLRVSRQATERGPGRGRGWRWRVHRSLALPPRRHLQRERVAA